MTFRKWVHTRSAARMSAYTFNYVTSMAGVGAGAISFHRWLFKKYVRWGDRRGLEPSGSVADLDGPSIGPNI